MKTLLKSSLIIVVLASLASCSPQRRLARLLEKHPLPEREISIETVTNIQYGDISIPYFVAGDSVIKEVTLPVETVLPDTSITAKIGGTSATAYLRNNRLGLDMVRKDTTMNVTADSVTTLQSDTVYVTVEKTVPTEVPVGKFWKHGFIAYSALILVTLILFFLLRRRK
jgi:hypothetical protein